MRGVSRVFLLRTIFKTYCKRTPVSGVWSSEQLLQAIDAGDQSILDSGVLSPASALSADLTLTLNRLKKIESRHGAGHNRPDGSIEVVGTTS